MILIALILIIFIIRYQILKNKRIKAIRYFRQYPDVFKIIMLHRNEFTYYESGYRLHNSVFIESTTEDIINKFTHKQCNAILELKNKKWELWNKNYEYMINILENYNDGAFYYIDKNKLHHSSIPIRILDKWFLKNLKEEELQKLADIDVAKYRDLQEKENDLFNVPKAKQDANKIRCYLRDNEVRYLYHFTDKKNLQSIITNGGLYSWSFCEKNNIVINNPGGGELSRSLDMKYNLADYVRLSFTNDHPMMYRKSQQGADLILLEIHPSVAVLENTLFSNKNATSSNFSIGAYLDDLKKVNIKATHAAYLKKTDDMFSEHQAEVLVKCCVPLQYILNIDKYGKVI